MIIQLENENDFLKSLIGKTIVEISKSDEELSFKFTNGDDVIFTHFQDCCEYVRIEGVHGELEDLLNVPLLMCELVTNIVDISNFETQTWTFYRFATVKGYVTVRWIGESNGYYSERVNIVLIENKS